MLEIKFGLSNKFKRLLDINTYRHHNKYFIIMGEPMENMSSKEIVDFFRNHVTHKKTGRIISKRFNIPYLEKNQKELLDQIMTRTSFLDDTFNIRERMFFLDREITTKQYCVVCGNAVHPQFYDGWHKASLNDVCSKICWDKHPRKSEILKEGCKHRDEDAAKIKRAATMKEKFGVEYTLQREDQRQKLRDRYKTNENVNSLEKLRDYEWVKEEYITKKRFLIDIADELKCHYSTVSDWVERHGFEIRQTMGYSQIEIEIRNYIESLGFNYIQNSKKILEDKTELDIYIPSKNIAIELDGISWHSFSYHESKEERELHLTKTTEAEKLNIQLLHFWCVEWSQKESIVKSIIKSKLGLNDTIYARKCKIKEISSKEADKFFNNNHLSGNSKTTYYIGLMYNDVLVHVSSFGKARYSKDHDYELVRSASILNNNVVGGLGKCLSYFVKTYCDKGDKILSYADKRYSNGRSYLAVGFEYIGNSTPGYWWIKNKNIWHRSKFMKKELHKHLENFDSTKSEATNMFEHNYRRLWDCGNLKFEYVVQ